MLKRSFFLQTFLKLLRQGGAEYWGVGDAGCITTSITASVFAIQLIYTLSYNVNSHASAYSVQTKLNIYTSKIFHYGDK